MNKFKITKEKSEKLFLAILVDVAFAFSVFVFIPYEIYLANIVDFDFSLNKFWMPAALGFVFLGGTFFLHTMLVKTKFFKLYIGLIMGFTVAGYIQSMFFNGMMNKLDGTVEDWNIATKIVNLLLWILIVLSILAIIKVFQEKWEIIYKFISIMILGMQGVALLSLSLTTEIPKYDEMKITDKGLCEVAEDNNVIIFCLDRCDQKYMDLTLEKFPDVWNKMSGFVYYPNATGKYCFTHIAVPYLLTGNMIPEYDPTEEQYSEQMDSSYYLNWILDNVGDVGIYTNEYCVKSDLAREKIDNCVVIDYILRKKKTANACIKSSLYRVLPFALKSGFQYSSDTFNKNIEGLNADKYNADSHEMEQRMLQELATDGLVINEEYGQSAFRFIHLKSTHGRYELFQDGGYMEGAYTSIEQCLAGDFAVIGKYCDELERLGLFESTTIIITGDHGATRVIRADESGINVNPIFMYKPKGVSREEMIKTSLAPVAHDDIFATVLNSYNADGSKYGFSLDDIHEGMERDRLYYWCKQDPEVKDKESCIHIEYEITGDSRDERNWKLTENSVYPNNSPKKK